jgi:cytochrome c1
MQMLMGAALLLIAAGCHRSEPTSYSSDIAGGDPRLGRLAIGRYGCGTCHTIPGIRGANALVGPSLEHIASRTYVAGVMINTPTNLITWIKNPPAVDDKTAMPNLHIPDSDVRHIASYLRTLR